MTASAPTTQELLAELVGRWRAFTTSDDQRRAEYLLGDAWREISRIPGLLERIAQDDDLAADARRIACAAAKRAMVAEGRLGVVEEERTDGPISRRRKYATTDHADVELTDEERSRLAGPVAAADGAVQPRWTGDVLAPGFGSVLLPRPAGRPW